MKFFSRFRYSPWVVVDFVVLRGSCHYFHDIDRCIILISIILSVWFTATKIIHILRFHLLDLCFNSYNYTSKVYKMSTEDVELVKYNFHCISVGLILNFFLSHHLLQLISNFISNQSSFFQIKIYTFLGTFKIILIL